MEAKSINPYVVPGIIMVKKTIPQIGAILLAELGTDLPTMQRKTRKREIVAMRQQMMFLMRWYGYGQAAIGQYFDKDHATVLHSVRTIDNDMLINKELKEFIRRMQHTKLAKE